MNHVKIFGITLFSVLQKASKKYVVHDKGYEKYVESLFSESRLELKSDIFINLSIPQMNLMDKSGCDYVHYVIYSIELPSKYKSRLLKAAEEYSFLRPLEVSCYEDFDIKEEIQKEISPGVEFALFGLDDDDLLSVDYLQKISPYIKKDLVGFNVVMSKGYSGFFDTKLSNCREIRFPFINIGQARICERKTDGAIYIPVKGSHMKTDETCPTVIDSRTATFFWFRHTAQDTFSKMELLKAALKINSDLDEYPYPNEEVTVRFPVLSRVLKNENMKLIAHKNTILLENKKQSKCLFNELQDMRLCGRVVIDYKLKNLSGSSKKQALATFELSGEIERREISETGLALSKVGYYRYFNTSETHSAGSFSINLPEGVFLTKVNAMKWGEENVEIESVSICQFVNDVEGE